MYCYKRCLRSTAVWHIKVFIFTYNTFAFAEPSNESYISFTNKSSNGTFHISNNNRLYVIDDNRKSEYSTNTSDNHDRNSQMSWQETIAVELMHMSEINIIPKIKVSLLPVHIAIINGQNNELVSLLKNQQIINDRTYNNLTLLHLAAIYNNSEAVSILLEHNANVLAVTTGDLTSLHIACIYSSTEVAKLLINKTALVSMKAANNLTALHFAAASNSINITTVLAEHNAVIDATDRDQQTPFYIALKYNNKELAHNLIHKGAHVNLLLENDTTLLHLAVQKDDKNAIKLLLTYPNLINKTDSFGLSVLHFAALYGRLNACKILLENGANNFARNLDNDMPIHIAASIGKTDIAKLLLEQNLTLINARGQRNFTPIIYAVLYNHSETVNLLLSKGANVNDHSYIGCNCTKYDPSDAVIHIATRNGLTNILKILLAYNANIFERTNFENTPIHLAAMYGKIDIIQILIEKNSNLLEVKNYWNATPIYEAVKYNQSEITSFLLLKGSNVNDTATYEDDRNGIIQSVTILHLAALNGFTNILKIILNYKPDIFAKDNDGNMPIHFAAWNGSTDSVAILLEHSQTLINARGGRYNETPIFKAVRSNQSEVTSFLLNKGANVNDTANYVEKLCEQCPERIKPSVTILHWAARLRLKNIIKILLKYKPNVFAKDKDGNMPIHLAAKGGSTEVVGLLLEQTPSLINATGYMNYTPLHNALSEKWTETIRFLLSKVDNVNATVNYHNDSKGSKPPVILKYKPDIFARDEDGFMPIHLAAENGFTDAIAILLEQSPSLINATGGYMNYTPLHYAVFYEWAEILSFLFSKVDSINATANGFNGSEAEKPTVILKYNPDVFAKDKDGNMPIHLAAENGFTDAVDIFIKLRPSLINATGGSKNYTPLHCALWQQKTETVRFLLSKVDNINATVNYHNESEETKPPVILKYKPDIFAKDSIGNMPIHFAALHGFTDAVDIFIKLRPSLINATDDSMNHTPLHNALSGEQTETVSFLLSKVDDVNATANYHDSEESKPPFILKYKPDIFAKDKNGIMPIHLAALKGFTDAVDIFIKLSPSLINATDGNTNCTPLHYAVSKNQTKTISFLLSKVDNVNATVKYHNDSEESKPPVMLKYKPDIFAKDSSGDMPIHWAAWNGFTDVVDIFIKLSPSLINATSGYMNYTPLHFALSGKQTETIRFLLSKVDNINATVNYHNDSVESKPIILKYKPDIFAKDTHDNMPIHLAAENGFTDAIAILLKQSPRLINATGGYMNYTPLHYALSEKQTETIKFLLSKVDNINATVNYHNDSKERKPFILKYKPDIFAKDKNGDMSIHLAAEKGFTDAIAILLEQSPSLIDKRGQCNFTPIFFSVMNNHSDITSLLLRNSVNISDTAYYCDKNIYSILSQNDQSATDQRNLIPFSEMSEIFKNKISSIDIKSFSKNANIAVTSYDSTESKGTKPSVTILHLAAQKGLTNILRIILKYKPEIFAKDNNGDMPIHKAASSGTASAVCILLKKNSRLINVAGHMNYTPLHYVVHSPAYVEDDKIDIDENYIDRTQECDKAVLWTLLQHGGDRFARDKYGYTPIDLAKIFNKIECLKILNEFNNSFSNDSSMLYAIQAKEIFAVSGCINDSAGFEEEAPVNETETTSATTSISPSKSAASGLFSTSVSLWACFIFCIVFYFQYIQCMK